MKILIITPPLLQPNTPYASGPLLAGWLKSIGHEAVQADLSLGLLLRLFSEEGVDALTEGLGLPPEAMQPWRSVVGEVIAFLQGRNPGAAAQLARRGYLPEGENLARAYAQEEQLGWNFRGLDTHDRARHLASLFIDDLAETAAELDPHFGFSRYAEKLAASLPDFAPLREALEGSGSIFFQWLEELTDRAMQQHRPDMVVLTVPFPGCLLGALAIAERIKHTFKGVIFNAENSGKTEENSKNHTFKGVRIVMVGGYVNTELRELSDPAVFDYVDAVTLDSGFLPLQRLAEGGPPVRTFMRENGKVVFRTSEAEEIAHADLPAPDFQGLEPGDYFGLFETLNPVTRLWSDERWNKLVLAHGCCWSRCAFCDTSIDYIGRYDPADAATVCRWIEAVVEATGFRGFHFVDESLPPALLDTLCDEMLCRGLDIEWWGNIRFEKRFSRELIEKMAAAGCIAVTGGLETCNDRTLRLMRKGITVGYAAEVLNDLAEAGIMTHAYLMYGFPTQTEEETFQALETVRGLFASDVLHSAYWHRFALTAHSEVARNPEAFGIRLLPAPESRFALNEIPFDGRFDYDLERTGRALKAAVYNYMLGVGLDLPVREWLDMADSGSAEPADPE